MNNKIKYLQEELTFDVSGQKLFEISKEINSWINSQKINLGHLTVFIKHTTASIIIQENYSNDVLEDIQKFFHKLVNSVTYPPISFYSPKDFLASSTV